MILVVRSSKKKSPQAWQRASDCSRIGRKNSGAAHRGSTEDRPPKRSRIRPASQGMSRRAYGHWDIVTTKAPPYHRCSSTTLIEHLTFDTSLLCSSPRHTLSHPTEARTPPTRQSADGEKPNFPTREPVSKTASSIPIGREKGQTPTAGPSPLLTSSSH